MPVATLYSYYWNKKKQNTLAPSYRDSAVLMLVAANAPQPQPKKALSTYARIEKRERTDGAGYGGFSDSKHLRREL